MRVGLVPNGQRFPDQPRAEHSPPFRFGEGKLSTKVKGKALPSGIVVAARAA